MFNEIVLMNVMISMTLFTNFIPYSEQQYLNGWIYISLILFSVFVNLSIIFYDNLNYLRLILTMLFNNRNNLKLKFIDILMQKGIIEMRDLNLFYTKNS